MRPTCRSTIDRESTDVLVVLPLISAEVSTVTISVAYRSTIGGIPVNYRQNVGRVSFDSRANVDRWEHRRLIYRPTYQSTSDGRHWLAEYFSFLYAFVERVLWAITAKRTTKSAYCYRTKYYRPMYRAIYRPMPRLIHRPMYRPILDTIGRYIDRYIAQPLTIP